MKGDNMAWTFSTKLLCNVKQLQQANMLLGCRVLSESVLSFPCLQ